MIWPWTHGRIISTVTRGRGVSASRRMSVAATTFVFLLCAFPGQGAPAPAGSTAAVLSFVDASAGRVEVVRHWPGAAATDVEVYPFIPYFWDGCPGPGAIMMLIEGPTGGTPFSERIAEALENRLPAAAPVRAEIARIIEALRTPGDPVEEQLKVLIPGLSDLFTYERLGYAVFVFIHWQGIWCAVSVQAVPEGYGIPFVR